MVKKVKKTHLTEEEINRINIENEIERSRKKDIRILQLEKQTKLLSKRVLELQIQLLDTEVSTKDSILLKTMERHVKDRKQYAEFFDKLKEELDVKTKTFGYDPDTGEVKLD